MTLEDEMKENQRVLAFGLTSCGKKSFDGDAVLLVELCDSQRNAKILYEGTEYQLHKKQLEEIKFLYPNEIYVRDYSLDDVNSSKPSVCLPCDKGNIANFYARRGSHWLRYILAPEQLHLLSEDDEQIAEQKGFNLGTVILYVEKLKKVLKDSGIKESKINKILDEL